MTACLLAASLRDRSVTWLSTEASSSWPFISRPSIGHDHTIASVKYRSDSKDPKHSSLPASLIAWCNECSILLVAAVQEPVITIFRVKTEFDKQT